MDQLLAGYEMFDTVFCVFVLYTLQEGFKELKGMIKYGYDIFCRSMGKKKYLLKQTGSMRRCCDGEYLGSDKTCETLAT